MRIKMFENGPIMIDTRERVSIQTGDGTEKVTGPIYLCRCGQSARKPFCDGTHNKTGFEGPARLDKFKGGQSNPTFKLTAASGTYVLRRQPAGKLLKSAHAVDREFRVMEALAGSGVPVPRVHGLCESRDVIGSMFYVMEFCDGRIFWDATLAPLDSNEERSTVYDEMNRVLAALHCVDPAAVGLADYGKPGNYFARQLTRWTGQYRASELAPIPAMEDLMAWLDANQPPDDGRVALVHGDYRLDNMVFHAREPRIIAVLDWELSAVGDPFMDLGASLAYWVQKDDSDEAQAMATLPTMICRDLRR